MSTDSSPKPKTTLTASQVEALNTTRSVFVEAGAGSGKTTILVERYLTILNTSPHTKPDNILTLTFTEKAAEEMKERIQHQLQHSQHKTALSYDIDSAHIGTIHGFCSQLLRQYPSQSRMDPRFKILSDDEELDLWDTALTRTLNQAKTDYPDTLQAVLNFFSLKRLKQHITTLLKQEDLFIWWKTHHHTLPTLDALLEEDDTSELTTLSLDITQKLIQLTDLCLDHIALIKHKKGQYGFSDLIINTHHLLHQHPLITQQLQNTFHHIMVDEFQDTDPLQWDIIQKLMHPTTKLFLVGDLKQSIYAFRGADPLLFLDIQNTFESRFNGRVLHLKDNFRSAPDIIHFINHVFKDIFQQEPTPIPYTPLTAQAPLSGQVEACFLDEKNMEQEAAVIKQWIQTLLEKDPSLPLDHIAILLRRKTHMTQIKQILDSSGLPADIHSGSKLYQQQEVIDLINIVHFLINPDDTIALLGVLKSPMFGCTNDDLLHLYQLIDTSKASLWERCHPLTQPPAPNTTHPHLYRHITILQSWLTQLASHTIPQLVSKITQTPEFQTHYRTQPNKPDTWANILAVLDKLLELEENGCSPYDMGQRLTTLTENPTTQQPIVTIQKNRIQILSIHASKGLEFPYVIIPECGKSFNFSKSEGLVLSRDLGPGISLGITMNKDKNLHRQRILETLENNIIEEEKRVFYVACTRAKQRLLLIGKKEEKKPKKAQTFFDFLRPYLTLHANHAELTTSTGTLHIHTLLTQPIAYATRPHTSPQTLPVPDDTTLTISQPKLKPASAIAFDTLLHHVEHGTPLSKATLVQNSTFYAPEIAATLPDTTSLPTPKGPQYGAWIHKLLEHINTTHPSFLEIPALVQHHAEGLKPSQKSWQRHGEKIAMTYVSSPLYQQLISASQRFIEKTFTYCESGRLTTCRMDALFSSNKTHWTLIDFKTDSQPNPSYRHQLIGYAYILSNLLHISPQNITLQLVYVETGDIHTLNYNNADLELWKNVFKAT